jgi:Uma2 family endonuclease
MDQVYDQEFMDSIKPDISHIEIEDGAPVERIRSEKQMRLLAESMNTSWEGPPVEAEGERRPFVVLTNVGLFSTPNDPPIVPDVMVSMDVALRQDLTRKENNTYFMWEFGKPPELAIEIVSNRKGGEDTRKLRDYARIGVAYYVVFDPDHFLSRQTLRMYELRHRSYIEMKETWMPALELGLTLWYGVYEGIDDVWLRWCDIDGEVLPTGAELVQREIERAERERRRADRAEEQAESAEERAEQERVRAEQAERRIDRLMAQLRLLGVELPDDNNGASSLG